MMYENISNAKHTKNKFESNYPINLVPHHIYFIIRDFCGDVIRVFCSANILI